MNHRDVVAKLTSVRQHQMDGKRAPHKPLLILLALGQLSNTGASALTWSAVEERLGRMLADFGRPTRDGKVLPSYPFTRLRADGVWQLSRDVPDDNVGPLNESPIEGSFNADIETALQNSPASVLEVARLIVEEQFPLTLAPDVLIAAGLDPEVVFAGVAAPLVNPDRRKRDSAWAYRVLEAWDRACAFCGYDGSLAGSPVGIEAAHVRWFNFGGPDSLDNGLALCALHHKLLDRGVLGLDDPETVRVSATFAAVSPTGRAIYDLHGAKLRPRPGTVLPSTDYVTWHAEEVFKGVSLSAQS